MDRIYSAIFSKTQSLNTLQSLGKKKNERFPNDSTKIACSSRNPLLLSTVHDTHTVAPDEPPILLQNEILQLFKYSARATSISFGVKLLSSLLVAAHRPRLRRDVWMDEIHHFIDKDALRFGAFMGSLVAVFRATEIILRRCRGERTRMHLAIAGTY